MTSDTANLRSISSIVYMGVAFEPLCMEPTTRRSMLASLQQGSSVPTAHSTRFRTEGQQEDVHVTLASSESLRILHTVDDINPA